MGGDGGQIIDRGTMVKTKGWGFTKGAGDRYANSLGEMANYVQMISEDRGQGPLERHRMRMTTCWLSQQALAEPVVACRLGNLYNKEALLGALLNRTMPATLEHLRGLKDVKQCLLTWADVEGERRIVCPVSREDLDAGSSRAVIIWSTGAVVSAKTLKELKLKECPVTGKAFDPVQDVMPLAPEGEELERLRSLLPPGKKRKAPEAIAASADGKPEPTAAAAAPSSSSAPPAASPPTASRPAEAVSADVSKAQRLHPPKSHVYKSLFTKDGPSGFNGSRDAFGTPAYNRGSSIA